MLQKGKVSTPNCRLQQHQSYEEARAAEIGDVPKICNPLVYQDVYTPVGMDMRYVAAYSIGSRHDDTTIYSGRVTEYCCSRTHLHLSRRLGVGGSVGYPTENSDISKTRQIDVSKYQSSDTWKIRRIDVSKHRTFDIYMLCRTLIVLL